MYVFVLNFFKLVDFRQHKPAFFLKTCQENAVLLSEANVPSMHYTLKSEITESVGSFTEAQLGSIESKLGEANTYQASNTHSSSPPKCRHFNQTISIDVDDFHYYFVFKDIFLTKCQLWYRDKNECGRKDV